MTRESAQQRTAHDEMKLIESFARRRDGQETRFDAWFGWRPSTGTRCPRTLAGKRCIAYSRRRDTDRCACERHSHVLDHSRRWLDRDGKPVLTAEPYNFAGEEFASLVADCSQLGLRVSVRGTSPYFPGQTVLIVIRKDGR